MTDHHSGKSTSTGASALRLERFAFTFDVNTGTVVTFESVDPAGRRHKLSKSEKIDLAKENHVPTLEVLLENAFEAGIACVLGEGSQAGVTERETPDDKDLRRLLLKPLIERIAAARLMKREVLRQAIVQTLLEDVTKSADSESESPAEQKSTEHKPNRTAS
jgi:hypothetical protein